MSLYNDISNSLKQQTSGVLGGIGSAITDAMGGGQFSSAVGALGQSYTDNAISQVQYDFLGGDILGTGAVDSLLSGDILGAGANIMDSALLDRLLPGVAGSVLSQFRYWGTPTPLFGGISPADAKKIITEMQAVKFSKKNLFLIEVSSPLGNVSKRFNMFVTGLDYSPLTLSGEKHEIGCVSVNSINSAEPTELSITTLDDNDGFIKNWFKAHCYVAASSNGTVGVPGLYAIKIKILHGFITRDSQSGGLFSSLIKSFLPQTSSKTSGYEDIGLFKPVNMDLSLSRREDDLEEIQMTFSQLDTYRSA